MMEEEETISNDTPESEGAGNGQGTSTDVHDGAASEPVQGPQGATADEVRAIVAETLRDAMNEHEGNVSTLVSSVHAETMGTLGAVQGGNAVELVTAQDAFSFVPSGTPEYVAQYFTPFLWGIAAGFVAFVIGYLWESFVRLLGLAGRK